MRKTIGQLLRGTIYAMVYGREGSGKTMLPMTLSQVEGGLDVAYITPEEGGPTSLISAGYSPNIPVELLDNGSDPFEAATAAIEAFTKDKTIKVIVLDGCTVLCGRGIDYLSGGEGEKALGWDGWGQMLAGFRNVESAAEKAKRAGKSFIYTAWEQEPTYEKTMAGDSLKSQGRPLIKGQGKTWLPGNCDIVARMTSSFKKEVGANGKVQKVFKAELQLNASEEWLTKCRWKLRDPYPADLRQMLDEVSGQTKAVQKVSAPLKRIK